MKKALLLFCFFILSLSSIKAQSLYFPPTFGSTWDTISPSSLGWCQDEIDTLYDYLQDRYTKAFIVLKDGKIVLEKYYDSFTKDSLWYWASAGKTMTAFLVGMAQQENYLKITDTSSQYLGNGWTSLSPTQEEKITVWHQLTMTSGLDDGGNVDCTDDTCLTYLADAGTRWAYHNAPYTLLDSVIESATGSNLSSYLISKLTSQTGIIGTYIKQTYNNVLFSKPRVMARFGLLCLNEGTWNSTPIMTDTAYFNQMTNTSQSLNESYGYLWWLNGKSSYMLPSVQIVFPGSILPNAPADMYSALGKNGQILNVVPSQNLVVVRMGNSPNSSPVPSLFADTIWQYLNEVMCSSTGINNKALDKVSVYPNPSDNFISINNITGPFKAEILNLDGRVLKTYINANSLSVESLSNGTYMLRIIDDQNNMKTIKFIKQ